MPATRMLTLRKLRRIMRLHHEGASAREIVRVTQAALTGRPLHFWRPDMLHISNFDGVACIITGITVTNPALVERIRRQALIHSDQEITAHLANAIANASVSAHAHAWQESNYGEAAPETGVDLEYYQDFVSAWIMVAAERGIETLDALHFADHPTH